MFWKYGGHQHPAQEVNLVRFEIQPLYTRRRVRWATLYRAHLLGELIYTGQDTLRNKMNELIAAYADNYKDFGLYHDDGTPSPHFIQNNHPDNYSGNLITYRSWPRGEPDEYATVRTFQIIIEATFINPDSNLVEWRESVALQGTGGPKWEWRKAWVRTGGIITPVDFQIQTNPATTQWIYQYGYAEGLTVYPVGNVPPPLFPAWEEQWKRSWIQHDPERLGQGFVRFPLSWQYVMQAPTGQSVAPNLF